MSAFGCDMPFDLKLTNHSMVLQNHSVIVEAVFNRAERPLSACRLRIQYNPTALTLIDVDPGSFMDRNGWGNPEFEYPVGIDTELVDSEVSFVIEAQSGGEANQPDSGESLVKLSFFVTNDRDLLCTNHPVRFYWSDCDDNILFSGHGKRAYVSHWVFDPYDNEITQDAGLPSYCGAPDYCLNDEKGGGEFVHKRSVDFRHGTVNIICPDSLDCSGDIDGNGWAFEVNDAVVFGDYFSNCVRPIPCSDMNGNGYFGDYGDYYYLLCRCIGDVLPLASQSQLPSLNDIRIPRDGILTVEAQDGTLNIFAECEMSVGSYHFQFVGDNMEVVDYTSQWFSSKGYELHCGDTLNVFSRAGMQFDPDYTSWESMHLLTMSYTGSAPDLVFVTLTGPGGEWIDVEINQVTAVDESESNYLPDCFALRQNYPNPFNPATEIRFDLPGRIEWRLEIFDITGRKVRSFTGVDPAGTVALTWDGTDSRGEGLPTGVYLYRLKAGEYTSTKKMLLLK